MTPALPPEVDDLQDDQDQQDQDQPRVSGADYLASVNQPKISGADYLKQATQPKPTGPSIGPAEPKKNLGWRDVARYAAAGAVPSLAPILLNTQDAQRAKEAVMGNPQEGESAIGRAMGEHYSAPTEKETPAADLPLVKPTTLTPQEGIARGVAKTAEGLTTAPNAILAAGTAGTGSLAGELGATIIPRLVSAGFSTQMLHSAYQAIPEFKKAVDAGDYDRAKTIATEGVLSGVMGVAAGAHALFGSGAGEAPKPEEARPIAVPPIPEGRERPAVSAQEYLRNVGVNQLPSAAEQSAQVFRQAPTYAELFDQADKLEARRARTKPEVPETGIPEQVARVADARERLAAKLADGKSFGELKNSDRIAVDDLITQGYGFAADKPAPEPTAEAPTIPEKPDTIDAQMEQLKGGARSAVMIPLGTKMPSRIPKTLNVIRVPKVGSFVFDSDSITPKEIRVAARENRLTDILGAKEGGMGAPDKSQLQPPVAAVVGKTPEGVTTQGTLADEASLPTAIEQTQKLTPPDGSVQVVPPEQEVAARTAPEAIKPAAEGNDARVFTPNQTPANVRYAIVDADQLRTSFEPGYDQDLQPRQTDRIQSRQRIEELKQTLNPDQMGGSVNAGDGSPIILPSGQVVTRNHGTMALKEMYNSGGPKIQEYRQWLARNAATLGIDPAAVESTAKPVLTRVMTDQMPRPDLARFAEEANFSSTARMSDAEQAALLAKRISGPVMEAFDPGEDGTPNPEFARALLSGMPQQERAAFQDASGRLSQTGIRTIRNAIFAKAYPDTTAIERMAESTDSNVRNISNGMLSAAPDFVRLNASVADGTRFDRGIAEETSRAAEVISGLKDQGMTVDQWLKQENLYGRDDLVDKMVQVFAENRRSPKRISQVLKEYTNAVDLLGDPRQEGMFGPVEPPTRLELLNAADEAVKQRIAAEKETGKTGELFPASEGAPPDSAAPGANAAGSPWGPEKGAIPADPLGVIPFWKKDVQPAVQALASGSKEAIDAIVHVVAPSAGVEPRVLDTLRKMTGGRDAEQFIIHRQLEAWKGAVSQLSESQLIDFIDRQKAGKPQATPELEQLSDFLRKSDDAIYNELKKYKPSLNYLENHFRVMWDKIPGAPEKNGLRGLFSRRPLQGSKGMLLQHTLDTISEGIARGGVPVTLDPIRMFELSYADSMKYITAQRMWNSIGDMGMREFVKGAHDRTPPPDGKEWIDDNIAKTYFKTPEGLLVDGGRWAADEGAARLLNNHLSRDRIRENVIGRGLMGIKNATTAIELAVSPFHAVFEALETIGSSIGTGMRRIVNLGFRQGRADQLLKGVGEILTAPAEAVPFLRVKGVGTSQLGKRALDLYGDFDKYSKTPEGQQLLKEYPNARDLVQDGFEAGIKPNMPEDYRLRAIESFRDTARQALRDGNMPGFVLRALPAANEMIMSPLFEKYIPHLKWGMFMRDYSLALDEFGDRIANGEMSRATLARKVADSVENRFGEMNFDNLFWNRTFKTAAQLMFRSVTWKLGNVRAYKDALLGQGRELARPFQGKGAPALDPNMGWLLGMSLWTAALGGAIHSIATGQAPQQLKDFIYPVIDKASGIRVSVPTYWRDMVSAAHSPLGYAKSGMSGEIMRALDVWSNKDFYGNLIWQPDDPLPREVLDGVDHMVPIPFSAQSKKQAQQQGGSAAAQAAGYAGFTKAPSWLEMTPMQQRMREYQAALRPVGGRTSQQAQSDQLRADILRGLRKGSDMSGVIDTAVQHGMLSQQQVRSLYRSSLEDPDARGFARMDINQAAELFGLANKEEREKLQPLLETKAWRALANPGRWTPKTKQSIHALGLPTPDESQQLQPQ